jgi:glycosyltransferase involved in cell wall biosynthesis
MQIEVVDDCSTKDDPAAVVRELSPDGRVAFFRHPANVGAIANYNACVARSTGDLVHVLHGDDRVEPGFYTAIETLDATHPGLHFFAVRSIHIDGTGAILRLIDRIPAWEKPSNDPSLFFQANHIQCPAAVVRRALYERAGGFRPELAHTADCEMWARALAVGGGVLSPLPLASYRIHGNNDTARVVTSGEWLRDHGRLRAVFSALYPSFDEARFNVELSARALSIVRGYESAGRTEAAAANRRAWKEVMPPAFRRRHLIQAMVLRLLRPPLRALGLHLDRA